MLKVENKSSRFIHHVLHTCGELFLLMIIKGTLLSLCLRASIYEYCHAIIANCYGLIQIKKLTPMEQFKLSF